jgi:hypothetical protein
MWQHLLQFLPKAKHYLLCLLYLTWLFLLGFGASAVLVMQWGILVSWVDHLTNNEIDMLGGIIGAGMTGVAAVIGVWVAFKQLRKQFEQKVIYEAWTDFQKHLFSFSFALSDFDTKVLWLKYSVQNKNNRLVNGGDLERFWNEKQQEIFGSYQELMHASVLLLQSFETHEVIFLSLRHMKDIFNQQCQSLIFEKYQDFQQVIFPIMSGMESFSVDDQLHFIDEYWKGMTIVSGYLDDFRVELQNETIGKILNRSVPHRIPTQPMTILTKRGLKLVNL